MASKKAKNKKNADMEFLQTALDNNMQAITDGPRKKKWSEHDLKTIQPLTPRQEDVFTSFYNNKQLLVHGSAGSGKTFLSVFMGLQLILDPKSDQDRIIIVRSAVPTRDMGFMPGTDEEKSSLYEVPYRDIVGDLMRRHSTYDDMKEAGIIEFKTTSYIRGLTWDNAVVIVDEVENLTFHEINSVMTRLGKNTRVMLVGDYIQSDLIKKASDKSGMPHLMDVIKNMKEFDAIEFLRQDIVRGELVKQWIEAVELTME